MEIQASSITFRCGAPNCPKKQTTDFQLIDDIVRTDASSLLGWKLPENWREERVEIPGAVYFIICCPAHTVEIEPVFKQRVVQEGFSG